MKVAQPIVVFRTAVTALILSIVGGCSSNDDLSIPDITVTFKTWTCPATVAEADLESGDVPAACTAVDVAGTIEVHSREPGTRPDNVTWATASTSGPSTTIEDIEYNGSGLFFRMPVPSGTAMIRKQPGINALFPGYSSVAFQYENGARTAESFAYITSEEFEVDILFLQSPLEPVADASISFVHWNCPGTYENFDPSLCQSRDAEPYLFSGPRTLEGVAARIPAYQIDGQTTTLTELDPVTYIFGPDDAGLAGASISQRVIVIDADEAQSLSSNLFSTSSDFVNINNLFVDVSNEDSSQVFNVYEFEIAVPAATPESTPIT